MASLRNDGGGMARYGLPGVLLGLALAWGLVGGRGLWAQAHLTLPADRARTTTPSGDGAGTLAFTAPVAGQAGNGTAQLLYLIDTRTRSFAVYRIDPTNPKGAIKLEGARQYQWDLKLSEYNNQAPEPAAIEAAVKATGEPKR